MGKSALSWVRRSARVIRMVSELHRMGFQRLRIMPYEYPLAYRVWIGERSTFSLVNGAYCPKSHADGIPGAGYSSASEDEYFEWSDAKGHNSRALADKFVQRFPDLCAIGKGSDWAYAGWLSDLVARLEECPGRLPIIMDEFMEPGPEKITALPLKLYGERTDADPGGDMWFPLPPIPA